MSKLFLALPVKIDDAIYDLAKGLIDEPQLNPHLTLMYCGKEVTDEEVEILATLWKGVLLGKFKEIPKVTLLPKFALFGKDNNVLVLKCNVGEALEDAVNTAREMSAKCVKSIPPSDFKFSPHVTLGFGGHVLPVAPSTLAGLGEQEAQDIILYGEGYTVRGVIRWSEIL
jgi:2'-5' RNA ligase